MLIIVAGPESSGTRVLTKALATHPDIEGTDGGHADVLDEVWQGAPFPEIENVVTRRSYPHAAEVGVAAKFLDFPDLGAMATKAQDAGHRVVVLIPIRAPHPHIASWAKHRASVKKDRDKAIVQYRQAYSEIVGVCSDMGLEWWFSPLEAMNDDYVASLFGLLGLEPHRAGVVYDGSDEKYYGSPTANGAVEP